MGCAKRTPRDLPHEPAPTPIRIWVAFFILPPTAPQGRGVFRDVQYVTFSDALTGAPIARLGDSSAKDGAVLLSAAAGIGSTRLLDNVMLVGDHTHLGAPAVADGGAIGPEDEWDQ